MSALTVMFHAFESDDPALVGGKGVNLGRLTKAGFAVPPGFVVTTAAYRAFIESNRLWPKIETIVASINLDNAEGLEASTAKIRTLIESSAIPAQISEAIAADYAELGNVPLVAVRSSGTAEDMAGASFAGQHDTYLNIHREDVLMDAVRRCWASLWTARAVAYRQRAGYEHASVGIAVVVQAMIQSEVSGVMFTANPMTAAVDEFVINASYGLGEAVVAGLVTPDLFVLDRDTAKVRNQTKGSKEIKIVRGPDGSGTRHETVSEAERDAFCLGDDQLAELGALGARVMAYYEGIPQDVEWALAGGQLFLLQSRDVTGVEFSWDEDLDNWQKLPKDDKTVWTRAWSDEVWTGAVTPLFYSFRHENSQINKSYLSNIWGINWGRDRRVYKYHKAFLYYNSAIDYEYLKDIVHPSMRRDQLLDHMPPQWHEDFRREPFSWTRFLNIWVRIGLLDPGLLPWNCWDTNYKKFKEIESTAHGVAEAELRRMTDAALKKYTAARMFAEAELSRVILPIHYLMMPTAISYFYHIVAEWYGDKDPTTVAVLSSGSPYQSETLKENLLLQELAELITNSTLLGDLFEKNPGAAFFREVERHDGAKTFLEKYRRFLADYGHRGHADRDIWFDRRCENPALTYAALQPMIGMDFSLPEKLAKGAIDRREELTQKVVAKLKTMPFGEARAQAFLMLQEWMLRFLTQRDDERAHMDKITMSAKRAAMEVGRRLVERGVLEALDDFYFYSRDELFELLDTGRSTRLSRAKLVARRRNHARFRKEFTGPMYMIGDQYADLEVPIDEGDDPRLLKGVGTSRGKCTGVARVIAHQKDIGRVRKGEILVTTATDPGWTPVFMVISGLVLETGGLLAHGSLISREYGIPAVQIGNAMKRIADGALITVDGDAGRVIIEREPETDPDVAHGHAVAAE